MWLGLFNKCPLEGKIFKVEQIAVKGDRVLVWPHEFSPRHGEITKSGGWYYYDGIRYFDLEIYANEPTGLKELFEEFDTDKA
jgi:hypothetical protein